MSTSAANSPTARKPTTAKTEILPCSRTRTGAAYDPDLGTLLGKRPDDLPLQAGGRRTVIAGAYATLP
jgi:hypothetical protein